MASIALIPSVAEVEPIAPKMAFAVFSLCLLTGLQQRQASDDIFPLKQAATCEFGASVVIVCTREVLALCGRDDRRRT